MKFRNLLCMQVGDADAADPLRMVDVILPPDAENELCNSWKAVTSARRKVAPPLYDSFAGYRALVLEALSRDIRQALLMFPYPRDTALGSAGLAFESLRCDGHYDFASNMS